MSLESLSVVRNRALPLFQIAADQYRTRVPRGYPNVIDTPDRGVIGLEIDPNHALFLTSEGDALFAEIYRRPQRTDARAGAGYQKYGGIPFNDRRPIDATISDQDVRNLVAELMSYYNQQQTILFITDD